MLSWRIPISSKPRAQSSEARRTRTAHARVRLHYHRLRRPNALGCFQSELAPRAAPILGDHVIHAALNADRIDLHQVMGVTALDHSDASKASYRIRPLTRREIDRVGGSHPIAVDVRVLAATNRDL